MHAASGGWEGCVCVCVCASIQVCDGSTQVGSPAVCTTIEQWDTKLVETRKIYQCNRNPREDYGINKKRMNNRALSPQTALSRVARVLMQAPVSGPCTQGESVRALYTCGKISHLHACVHKQKRPQSNAKCTQEYYELSFIVFIILPRLLEDLTCVPFVYYW